MQWHQKKLNVENNIAIDDWRAHFEQLLDQETENIYNIDTDVSGSSFEKDLTYNNNEHTSDTQNELTEILNGPITKQEVMKAVKSLKKGTSAGPDGITGEFFKYWNDLCVDFWVTFFSNIFDKGMYPENWTESIMFSLHTKGNVCDPNNYRGISLLNVRSKLYSSIINDRQYLYGLIWMT